MLLEREEICSLGLCVVRGGGRGSVRGGGTLRTEEDGNVGLALKDGLGADLADLLQDRLVRQREMPPFPLSVSAGAGFPSRGVRREEEERCISGGGGMREGEGDGVSHSCRGCSRRETAQGGRELMIRKTRIPSFGQTATPQLVATQNRRVVQRLSGASTGTA